MDIHTLPALRLEALEVRDNPAGNVLDSAAHGVLINLSATTQQVPLVQQARPRFAVASDAGVATVVNVYDGPTNALLGVISPFGRNFTGGANVAVGDVTGDGVPDIVVSAAKGAAPIVKIFDGATLKEVRQFLAFGMSYTGGIHLAIGDVTGDGRADIIAGGGAANGPHVNVFDGRALTAANPALPVFPTQSYLAGDADFLGGVSVSVADVTGDGHADIVAGAGQGGKPRVVVLDGRTHAVAQDFLAYDAAVRTGVNVAAGDFGDGHGRVVTSAAGQAVRSFDGDRLTAEFRPIAGPGAAAVALAARDLGGKGTASLIVASGAGQKPQVVVINGLTGAKLRDFPAVTPNYATGLHVG